MSIESMIQSSPRTVTVSRPTYGHSAMGGVALSSSATTTAVGLLQVGGGSTGRRYGAERAQYDATLFFLPAIDVKDTDFITFVDDATATRTYRVEAVVNPDERPSLSHLAYQRVTLQEDRPKT